jgi:trans-aconitate methyltransferase
MMEATSIGSDKHVLDIGCGAGHSTALIKTADHETRRDAVEPAVDRR